MHRIASQCGCQADVTSTAAQESPPSRRRASPSQPGRWFDWGLSFAPLVVAFKTEEMPYEVIGFGTPDGGTGIRLRQISQSMSCSSCPTVAGLPILHEVSSVICDWYQGHARHSIGRHETCCANLEPVSSRNPELRTVDRKRMEDDPSIDTWTRLTEVGLVLLDRDRLLRYASPLARRLLDCESREDLRSRWPELLPRLLFAQVDSLDGNGESRCQTFDLQISDHRPLRGEVCSTDDGYLLLLKDRSRISQCEDHLLRSNQLDVLRFLSSTLVHDLSGPLHNLQLTVTLLQSAAAHSDQAQDSELQRHCQRCAGMLQQEVGRLRALIWDLPDHFNWPRRTPAREFDIRPVIEEATRRRTHEITARRIRHTLALSPESLIVHGEDQLLELALLDLLIVLTEACDTGANLHVEAQPCGGHVGIAVRADSCKLPRPVVDALDGVPSDQHVGLSVARMIIESHHGRLLVSREPDAGIRFDLSLPLCGRDPTLA